MTIKCAGCGQFIPNSEMFGSDRRARFYHTPLNEFGPEVCEWVCGDCEDRSRASRASPDRAETGTGSVSEANSTRSREAGDAQ